MGMSERKHTVQLRSKRREKPKQEVEVTEAELPLKSSRHFVGQNKA
jgi:hypothetical protein